MFETLSHCVECCHNLHDTNEAGIFFSGLLRKKGVLEARYRIVFIRCTV